MAQSEGACCWAHSLSLDPRADRGIWLLHVVSDLHAHAFNHHKFEVPQPHFRLWLY